ncbi:hypothetical protein RM533_12520 [Croceicoccus sp. F390]|uniref:Multidrug transporter n=1 Tax=Croceicoccus esteveae TaxID=3075597 RepID=A0ABU2ZNI5_9SPHN|nr:hypothetical protein [Croceicoccus sp. F390]MDT0576992.1 hypothetical protein [Croceicoccus sp. F390]
MVSREVSAMSFHIKNFYKGCIALLLLPIVIVIVLGGAIADVWLATFPGPVTKQAVSRFSLMGESNLPTWLASSLLLLCAAVSALITISAWLNRSADRVGWLMLSLFLLLLSVDEIAMFHELSGILLEAIIPEVRNLGGIFFYSWVLVAIPALLLVFLVFRKWASAQTKRFKSLFILGVIIFFSGAVGMEMFNAAYEASSPDSRISYAIFTAFEELLEFMGVIVILHALVAQLIRSGFSMGFGSSNTANPN